MHTIHKTYGQVIARPRFGQVNQIVSINQAAQVLLNFLVIFLCGDGHFYQQRDCLMFARTVLCNMYKRKTLMTTGRRATQMKTSMAT